jgi:Zn-finger nucleic acid-binding protein
VSEELKQLRDLHFMHCPKCGLQMHEVKLRGVNVDVCFSCNGVFLDHGELERLEKPEAKGVMSSILNWLKPETKKPG